jgi:hypothetical protein
MRGETSGVSLGRGLVMPFHQATLAVLLLALVSASTTVGAEETTREARVEATIQQPGFSMADGFGSVWMMSLTTNKLIRIRACHQLSQTTLATSWTAARKFRAVFS